jgi:lysophospholipase L1-like esterase
MSPKRERAPMSRLIVLVAAAAALVAGCASPGETESEDGSVAGSGGSAVSGSGGSGQGGSARGGTGGAGLGTGGAGAGTGGATGSGGKTGGTGGAGPIGSGGAGPVGSGGAGAGTGGRVTGAGGAGTGGRVTGTGGSGVGGGPADAGAPDGGSTAPGVRIVGRTAPGPTGGTLFEWSGTSIVARFTGTQVSIQLNDANNQNEFAVIVDGTVRTKVVTASGQTTYPLATGLASGTHDLVVWRRTEAKWGATEFLGLTGFSAGGGLVAPPAAPDHRIELIGDSITAGVGIEQTGTCSGTELNENNYLAYGSVAARALSADVVTIAWQGIGMYRNYNEAAPVAGDPTMPQRYDYSIPSAMTAWDFSKYQPQAVMINLTSNDFSTNGDPGTAYINTYVSFVQHVRTQYPDAYFFLIIEWSNATSDSSTDTNKIVTAVKAAGDSKIEAFDIRPFANGNACEGHPDTTGGQNMGTALANEIKKVLAW